MGISPNNYSHISCLDIQPRLLEDVQELSSRTHRAVSLTAPMSSPRDPTSPTQLTSLTSICHLVCGGHCLCLILSSWTGGPETWLHECAVEGAAGGLAWMVFHLWEHFFTRFYFVRFNVAPLMWCPERGWGVDLWSEICLDLSKFSGSAVVLRAAALWHGPWDLPMAVGNSLFPEKVGDYLNDKTPKTLMGTMEHDPARHI